MVGPAFDPTEESIILSQLCRNNEQGLVAVFDRYHRGLVYFCVKFIRDKAAAQDIAAEAFISFWKKKTQFLSLPAIRSYLYTSARNACINYLRQIRRHDLSHREIAYLSEPGEATLIASAVKAELLGKIWNDVEHLPEQRKEIFKMIFEQGLSVIEIAKSLKISVDTVRVQKARALHKLRANLNDPEKLSGDKNTG